MDLDSLLTRTKLKKTRSTSSPFVQAQSVLNFLLLYLCCNEVFVPWAMGMLNDQWPLMLGDPLRLDSNLFVYYT